MPKISAATVADHRAQQRRALVAAARALLESEGGAAVTFAAVAREAGLARNSVYKYFADRADLLSAVVRESAPRWTERIAAAMAAATTPEQRVAAYVRAQCELVRDGEHRIARALAGDRDAAALRAAAGDAHRELLTPLVAALAELGDDTPEFTAQLIQGLVNAAVTALESGAPYGPTTARAAALAVASLTALRPSGS
ncbi:TetR/AcrR family transcriptional regulator [Kitasatospora cheerisanensis]|uniref:TetR family transcriptional regulator n=1 Tax=Kitasatospora cheerisanensis KCTC 2395 TaxID=1348663 RepID=A0A066Z0U6_9ACTN|nr:TetR/AcrR family transcriptional regulator [Kitasatospora cheerisanensis]KDN87107.1 TetR family transcriptional regulator [Kitasatospora cheerisanensis KCTC 2395]